MLGGLSLLERAVRSGARAGLSEFLIVVGARGEHIRRTSESRLSDLPITWLTDDNWRSGNGASILAAAPFLGREHFLVMKVLGALVFWCASFLDGCDGELARLKFLESRLGGWLDLWADNLGHIMVFMGIGIGLWRDSRDAQWILLGIVAALGVFFSVAWVSWAVLRKKRGQGPLFTSVVAGELASRGSWTARLTRFADALSRRDFIFGTIFLALLGLLPAFLWAAAIGSHIYWTVLVLIAWKSRQASTAEA